ncbi:MAG: hypothetical protein IJY02_00115, partial [Oscillospiraceae bacterium]|nr:hypothetical protein [Oscillospiraceae bacterium]
MKILAIESSCDETAAAVVEDGRKVLSSSVNSQIAEHRKFGGVVPEIASRRHTENICDVTRDAMEQDHAPEMKGSAFWAVPSARVPAWNMGCLIFRSREGRIVLIDGGL